MKACKRIKIPETAVMISIITLLVCVLDWQTADAQSSPWPVPSQYVNMKNPITNDSAMHENAKILYTNYCSPCHGAKGNGDGFAGGTLNPKPAVHTSAFVQSESDGSLYYKMSEGRKVMPAYKVVLTENERWELVNYIRTLVNSGTAK
jgi:mono/diheme cytochrome c family protein